MFDPQSADLLQSAPALPGISPEDLPRQLTAIYTELVTNRLNSINKEQDIKSVQRLIEIATSYEIITAVQPEDSSRKAAAFVAGSAYQILSKSLPITNVEYELPLSRDHIDGQIAAALLFLIAEQYPDAREAIHGIYVDQQKTPLILQFLTESLIDMVLEDYNGILLRAVRREGYTNIQSYKSENSATIHLYQLILQGVELLAALILNVAPPNTVQNTNISPYDHFRRVLEASSKQYDDVPFSGGFLSTYPGPAHLASLLEKSAKHLQIASIINLPPPDGANLDTWSGWLRYRAKTKPILWPNHRDAISQGFHLLGNSSVIVLPTGAGKTTLSEFKIAATLASGKKVVFLAPTNALVDQLKVDLKLSIPANIFGEEDFHDLDLFITAGDSLSSLEVMTPEKCLAILNFNPGAFEEVGLLVFDECHSLSAESGSLRRSIDGMLVILNLQHFVPTVDLLFLSAMLQNGEDFAGWISELTGRKCLPIDTFWKPSRQARGVVIYSQTELQHVQDLASEQQTVLDQLKTQRGKKLAAEPQKLASDLVSVTPHALFGLVNNWHPDAPEDIRIMALSTFSYPLKPKFGYRRRIEATPSGNDVARILAVSCALAGLKTIVFINNAPWTHSSAKKISSIIPNFSGYNEHEQRLWNAIEIEFGIAEASMLYGMFSAVPHNANLHSFERQLAESLFKKADGAKVIFATTTLSQGMNLPAQVAILSANERISLEGERPKPEPLKAHELLNAAGRAGRAGYLANGMVILIPRTILTFDGVSPQGDAENILRTIIPENERCVIIIDPLRQILDQIQVGTPPSSDVEYIYHRLSEVKDGVSITDLTFSRSFAAYQAKKLGTTEAFSNDVNRLKAFMASRPVIQEIPDWLVLIAVQSGMSPTILSSLYSSIKLDFNDHPQTILDWLDWLLKWFGQNPEAAKYCFGNEMLSLCTLIGVQFMDEEHFLPSLTSLHRGMVPWLTGKTIAAIETELGGSMKGARVLCPKAREIATTLAPRNLSFFSSFLVQITKKISEELEIPIQNLAVLECFPAAISKGFDEPAKLAYYQSSNNRYLSRVEAHRNFMDMYSDIEFNKDVNYKSILEFMRNLSV